ncbi:MAG: DUF4011 domain-containing protein [Planctomycetota bacterium]
MSEELPEEDSASVPPAVDWIGIEIEFDARINFAMEQNDVPVVKILRLSRLGLDAESRDGGDESDENLGAFRDLEITIEIKADFAKPVRLHLSRIDPGQTVVLDRVDLRPRPERLAQQIESEFTTLTTTVRAQGRILGLDEQRLEILPFNHWPADAAPPEILAAFCLPNHPGIEATVAAARPYLARLTGSDSFDGYQSKDSRRVQAMVHAIYIATRDLGFGYANPPANFETQGQKVRLPEQMLANKLGTCIDLALFLAAALEQAGLAPILILLNGHAFVGCWLHEQRLLEPSISDGSYFRKFANLGGLVFVEATGLTTAPPLDFEEAVEAGLRGLSDERTFLYGIDIKGCRDVGVTPLPFRREDGVLVIEPRAREKTDPSSKTGEAESPEAGEPGLKLREVVRGPARVEHWKRRLLDLSLNNRFLNFRPTKKTLALEVHDLAVLEDALVSGSKFTIYGRPQAIEGQGIRDLDRRLEQTGEDLRRDYFVDQFKDKRLFSTVEQGETESRLLEIYRQARRTLEDTGANTLYLALGFLKWSEVEGAETRLRAPILLLPVSLTRKSAREDFRLVLGDEEPRVNVTLLEKLRQDFGLDTKELEELPEDERGLDIGEILARWRAAVLTIAGWDVEESASLALFTFSKFMIWQDLESNVEALMANDLVRHLIDRPGEDFRRQDQEPLTPESLDREVALRDIFCPRDADSTQLAAVVAATQGHSFVLQGPPGTGKSQTITNLIAQALAEGKRILFVAEKMAALDVVKDRLDAEGLGFACLEIHSNKASKRVVLDQLQEALEVSESKSPARWEQAVTRFETLRDDLNAYVQTLHEPGSFGLSVFEATGRVVALRGSSRVLIDAATLAGLDAETYEQDAELTSALATAVMAVEQVAPLSSHPLQGVGLGDWRPTLPRDFQSQLRALESAATKAEAGFSALAPDLELNPETNANLDLSALLPEALEFLTGPRPLLAEWISTTGWTERCARVHELLADGEQLKVIENDLALRWEVGEEPQHPSQLASRWRDLDNSFFVARWWGRRKIIKELEPWRGGRTLPDAAQVLEDLGHAQRLRELQTSIEKADESGRAAFGAAWLGLNSDWPRLRSAFEDGERLRATLQTIRRAKPKLSRNFEDRWLALCTDAGDEVTPGEILADRVADQIRLESELLQAREALADLLQAREGAFFAAGDEKECLYGRQVRRAQCWWESREALRDWCHFQRVLTSANDRGLGAFCDAMQSGDLRASELSQVVERSRLETWLEDRFESQPRLRQFNRGAHESNLAEFRRRDKELMALNRQVVAARVQARLPKTSGTEVKGSELALLRREITKKARHKSIRRLLAEAPNVIARLKPCLLMSPLSVSQYLDPALFAAADIVVFDEASQIPVWDAIGALARGKTAVVVGDTKQLPPTAFFQRAHTFVVDDYDLDAKAGDDEAAEEEIPEDLESVLDECLLNLREMRLGWHYRSRHESLIAFSNHHYYGNSLFTFPSPGEASDRVGVSHRFVEDGVYDRGRSAANRIEAEALVADLLIRLRDAEEDRSFGIVAFSQVQQKTIEDLLEKARARHPEIERHFHEGDAEALFVKNLENVQGDERDVIMFSVGYGRDDTGRLMMNFGPLNRPGGERRLNVAITRAREQLVVYSSILPEDIDLSRTRALAVKHLKVFLEYARRGPSVLAPLDDEVEAKDEAQKKAPLRKLGPGFVESLGATLRARGHEVATRVGSSSYRVDLALRDPKNPDRFWLGIECDGQNYRDAATARDRDRIRPEVMGHLGWELHRVWCVDWWQDPDGELDRIEAHLAAVAEAAATEAAVFEIEIEVEASSDGDANEDRGDDDPENPAEVHETEEAYGEAPAESPRFAVYPAIAPAPELGIGKAIYSKEMSAKVVERLAEVIDAEAPLHLDLLCRRLTDCFEGSRLTDKLRNFVGHHLALHAESFSSEIRGDQVWPRGSLSEHYELVRQPEDGESRDLGEIATEELANAVVLVLRDQIALDRGDLHRATAALFGTKRVGTKVAAAVDRGLEAVTSKGLARIEGERVIYT